MHEKTRSFTGHFYTAGSTAPPAGIPVSEYNFSFTPLANADRGKNIRKICDYTNIMLAKAPRRVRPQSPRNGAGEYAPYLRAQPASCQFVFGDEAGAFAGRRREPPAPLRSGHIFENGTSCPEKNTDCLLRCGGAFAHMLKARCASRREEECETGRGQAC
jgi:hypothetical protein